MARTNDRQAKLKISGRSPHTYTTKELKGEIIHFMNDYKKHKSGKLKSYSGIGVWDTGIFDWLLAIGAVSKKGSSHAVDPELYDRFQKKKALLEEYWGRVEFAEKHED